MTNLLTIVGIADDSNASFLIPIRSPMRSSVLAMLSWHWMPRAAVLWYCCPCRVLSYVRTKVVNRPALRFVIPIPILILDRKGRSIVEIEVIKSIESVYAMQICPFSLNTELKAEHNNTMGSIYRRPLSFLFRIESELELGLWKSDSL